MKISNIIVTIVALSIIIFNCLQAFSQLEKLDPGEARNDTIKVSFLDNFNYDVVFLQVNGIEIYNGILISKEETGTTYTSIDIFVSTNSINLQVILFERNRPFSIEFNPLWYSWNVDNDPAFYFPPKKQSIDFNPNKDGKFVYISLSQNKDNELGSKFPLIEVFQKKLILD